MNYNEIKQQHPKAWGELKDFVYKGHFVPTDINGNKFVFDDTALLFLNHSALFAFFDSKGIYITVDAYCFEDNPVVYEVSIFNELFIEQSPDRPSAETLGFQEAFSILEEQLNK